MNRLIKVGIAAVALAAAVPAFAEEAEEEESGAIGWTPVAFGLASPVQLPWGLAKWDVFGLDLNLFYSDAPLMYGLGIGGLGMTTRDTMAGLQVAGLFNYAMDEDVYGMRLTLGANISQGTVYGVEAGGFGYRKNFWGLDLEFLGSFQDELWGWQMSGLVNITKKQLYGFPGRNRREHCRSCLRLPAGGYLQHGQRTARLPDRHRELCRTLPVGLPDWYREHHHG